MTASDLAELAALQGQDQQDREGVDGLGAQYMRLHPADWLLLPPAPVSDRIVHLPCELLDAFLHVEILLIHETNAVE